MFQEFKKFALEGNVMDMAIGIIMPPIGIALAREAGAVTLNYGTS